MDVLPTIRSEHSDAIDAARVLLVFFVMKTAPILLSLFLFVAVGTMSQDGLPRPKGVIYGVVVDENNRPAKEIGITAAGPAGRVPGVITDKEGHYRFGNLWGLGKYAIYAEDWDAGYSIFTNSEFHEVTISAEHPETELNLRLPPRAGFLDFHLTNRKTGEEIRDLVVKVCATGKEFGTVSQSTTKPVLVPPDEDLLIHVSSHGFQEWNRSAGKGLPIRVKSGNHLKLDVQLQPAS
jgi:hypothetical protein